MDLRWSIRLAHADFRVLCILTWEDLSLINNSKIEPILLCLIEVDIKTNQLAIIFLRFCNEDLMFLFNNAPAERNQITALESSGKTRWVDVRGSVLLFTDSFAFK